METDNCVPVGAVYLKKHAASMEEILQVLAQRIPEVRVVSAVIVDGAHNVTSDADLTEAQISSLQSAEIMITLPNLVQNCLLSFPNLKWMHSLAAGIDKLTRSTDPSQIPSYVLTRNGTSFVESLAEYALSYVLAHERHHRIFDENQKLKLWKFLPYRNLSSLTIGILGVGEIGKEIARLAKSFKMTVWGLVRTPPTEEKKSEHVDEYRLFDGLSELLSSCDFVCSVLPSTRETDGILDGNVLSHCKNKKSVFINIGRGNVVRNATILHALNEGWISHAYLDVFETEPLPEDSGLWTHRDVTVTPHVSGTMIDANEFVDEFETNLELFRCGKPMKFVVDWTRGY